MTEQERELDLALAEALQENRKLRRENEHLQGALDDLEQQHSELQNILAVERMAIKDMGHILSNYEDLMAEMNEKIKKLESEQ